ncbi:MAG: phosphoenolpyruvate--protein phosphotransferase, partial [Treponema sp.]|nr:phosphoenolpyruvate--protein phosphotransferase [Treponema sp.]
MKTFTGIPASTGIAAAKALVYVENERPTFPHIGITEDEVPAELKRLQKAFEDAAGELKELHRRAKSQMGRVHADIFQAHLLMLEDEDFKGQLRDRLK